MPSGLKVPRQCPRHVGQTTGLREGSQLRGEKKYVHQATQTTSMPAPRLQAFVNRGLSQLGEAGSTLPMSMRFLSLLSAGALVACGLPPALTSADAGAVDAGPLLDAGEVDAGQTDAGRTSEIAWASTAGPAARDHHGTALVARGGTRWLVVFGGIDEVGRVAHRDLWTLGIGADNPREWVAAATPLFSQIGHGVAVAGQRVYSVSGRTVTPQGRVVNTPRVQSIGFTDAGPTAWREETPIPGMGQFHVTAAVVGPYLYALGGRNDLGGTLANIDRARIGDDGVLGAWETLTPLPEPRTHHALVALPDRLLVLGGFIANAWSDSGTNYRDAISARVNDDGSLSAWERQSIPFVQTTHAATVFDGFVYQFGGFDEQINPLATVRRAPIGADAALGDWQEMTRLPIARAHVHQVPIDEGRVYSFGGNIGNHVAVNTLNIGTMF